MFYAAALLLTLGIVCACAPLKVFNTLAPADNGAVLAKSNIAYGPLPRQTLDVYVPADHNTSKPIVVAFYGGSWNSGRKEDYAFLGKALASRGIVTVIADYRLVPDVRFPGFIEDGARAVHWAHQHASDYGGDPRRLFLFGHSAGAYNAVMIALDKNYLQALGTSPSIIKGVAALAGPYEFLPLAAASTKAAFGATQDLRQTQPLNFVSPQAPPMFLAAGEDDTTVKPRNTQALAEKLSRAGVPVTLKYYHGLGHVGILLALSKPFRRNVAVLDDVAAFIRQP